MGVFSSPRCPVWRRDARGRQTFAIVVLGVGALLLGGSTSAHARPVSRDQVVVVSKGFSIQPLAPGAIIEYGVTLRNRSPNLDAVRLTVSVNAVDNRGRSVATDEQDISVVPAGSAFNVAGQLTPNVTLAAPRLNATIKVGQMKRSHIRLPVVSGVRLHGSDGQYDRSVSGRVTNPYKKPLSDLAVIHAVFLDARGRIVGSAHDLTGAKVRPGATVAFVLFPANDPVKPVSVRISVDPCDSLDWGTSDCPIPTGNP